jgi:hypothetical protein
MVSLGRIAPGLNVRYWHICDTARRLNDDRLRLESGRGGERRQGDGLSLR